MVVDHPILTIEEMQALKDTSFREWRTVVIDCTTPVDAGPQGLVEALFNICEEAAEAVQVGYCYISFIGGLRQGRGRVKGGRPGRCWPLLNLTHL
jgi:hypothetical protein